MATIPDDTDCTHCDAKASRVTCCVCRVSAMITNCGHMAQPRPIAPDGHRTYCDACYDSRAALAGSEP